MAVHSIQNPKPSAPRWHLATNSQAAKDKVQLYCNFYSSFLLSQALIVESIHCLPNIINLHSKYIIGLKIFRDLELATNQPFHNPPHFEKQKRQERTRTKGRSNCVITISPLSLYGKRLYCDNNPRHI